MNTDYLVRMIRSSERKYFFRLATTGCDDSSQPRSPVAPGNLPREIIDLLLNGIEREVLRERKPQLQELESVLGSLLLQRGIRGEFDNAHDNSDAPAEGLDNYQNSSLPLVRKLIQEGYLRDESKWLTSKGFAKIGSRILEDVMKALKIGEIGLHDTQNLGSGSVILDTVRKYEAGGDVRLINIPVSLLNSVQRLQMELGRVEIPLKMKSEDFEEYETLRDVRTSVVYCIDLSSTMRYSTMFGDISRIEAAKKALWSLLLLNRKYFPNDTIHVVGFGSLASPVNIFDIPYLKTFEAGSDFLHYTNYQAAFRLSKKMLYKDGAANKRIILITDGHPSACFMDDSREVEKILATRPYSHFYKPGDSTLNSVKEEYDMKLDCSSGNMVYLCYRYKQVDQYIAERTIVEAAKCLKKGIYIDTLMISEEDSLLSFVNEMERRVMGRSYYVRPEALDRALLTDFIRNKKTMIHASG